MLTAAQHSPSCPSSLTSSRAPPAADLHVHRCCVLISQLQSVLHGLHLAGLVTLELLVACRASGQHVSQAWSCHVQGKSPGVSRMHAQERAGGMS
jgi:hypothetical protein